tara:strand:- start:138 stop:2600 length:2463 start_codon:yes stop_codon:yes gene_type:complete
MSNADELKKLKELLDSGVLSNEEFQKEKNKVLNSKQNNYKKNQTLIISVCVILVLVFLYLYNQGGDSQDTTIFPSELEEEDNSEVSYVVTNLEEAEQATVKIIAESQTFSISDFLSFENINTTGTGSGFFVSKEGHIVTNYHVIANASKISIYNSFNKTTTEAEIVAVSECDDLAVLKLKELNEAIFYFDWSDNSPVLSQEIFSTGFPLGTSDFTYLEGNVSKESTDGNQRWTSVESAFEHTAEILPGSSGGPIFDENFKIVGVAYAGNSFNQEFAIEGKYAQKIVANLIQSQNSETFGFYAEQFVDYGTLVTSIDKESTGYKAGLRSGDVITKLDKYDLSNEETLLLYCNVIRNANGENEISIEWFRLSNGYNYKSNVFGPEILDPIPVNAEEFSLITIDWYKELLFYGSGNRFVENVLITYSGNPNENQLEALISGVEDLNLNISNLSFSIKEIDSNESQFGKVHIDFSKSYLESNNILNKFSAYFGVEKIKDYWSTDLEPSDKNNIARSVLIEIPESSKFYNSANYINQNVNMTIFIQMIPGDDFYELIKIDSSIESCTKNFTLKVLTEGITLGEFLHNSDSYVNKVSWWGSILNGKYCDYYSKDKFTNSTFTEEDLTVLRAHFSPQNWQLKEGSKFYDDIYERFGFDGSNESKLPPSTSVQPEVKTTTAPLLFWWSYGSEYNVANRLVNAELGFRYRRGESLRTWSVNLIPLAIQGKLSNNEDFLFVEIHLKNNKYPEWKHIGWMGNYSWTFDLFYQQLNGDREYVDSDLTQGDNLFKFRIQYASNGNLSNVDYNSEFSPVFKLCLKEDLETTCNS